MLQYLGHAVHLTDTLGYVLVLLVYTYLLKPTGYCLL